MSAATAWPVKTMSGFNVGTPFIVTNPACPEGRHPTRGGTCGCKVFRYRQDAEAYAAEQVTRSTGQEPGR